MPVGILTSGAGLSAVSAPVSGALMFFSGAIAQASANSDTFRKMATPDDVKDDVENAYGNAFSAVLNATNGMKERDLTAEDWVFSRFVQGEGLSVPVITKALEAYVEATHKKWACCRAVSLLSAELLCVIARACQNESYDERTQSLTICLGGEPCIYSPRLVDLTSVHNSPTLSVNWISW
ncbi:hypothetical protein FSPOR_11906 [Fusarium sporotrichioides]|uniref:Uncharacterized protein n=1 Tax=Fusarium sporotrichioides TaxID=5514 RepID=A0A395RDU8_FUSSP|nr:hypothetical protein FSPOR_11906 [Fusarium sporotrichioides]